MKLLETIKSQIKVDAIKSLTNLKIEKKTNLYIYDEVLVKGEKLMAATLEVPIERDTAFVFADLAPACNWVHPCEYQLYDAKTGKLYKKVQASLPPSILALGPDNSNAIHTPVKMIDTLLKRKTWTNRIAPITNAPSASHGERYAILFTGKAENRHTNDMEFLYRTLIDVYGFNAANIQVANHDGTVNYFLGNNTSQTIGANLGNWPGNNTPYRMVVNQPGTRAGFQAALNAIAAQIQPGDFLLIHTNNHGGGLGDGAFTDFCMFVYDPVGTHWTPYYVNDFITDMGVLPPFESLMVMMEQCRSGGFIDPIINNSPANWTHVATAVVAADYSDGGANFDPFAEDWIAAMNGQYPDGGGLSQVVDTNNNGLVSAVEAFNYANAVVTGNDTPTSSDSPNGYGTYIYLGLPAHDLFIRDNLQDLGSEPLVNGGISCSPDIIIYNQELLDPEATLGSAAAQQSDTLGSCVEYGQDNFIYLRVQNRGMQPTSGTARLFWANPSILPTPNSWHEITDPANPIAIPAINPQEMKIVGPIVWNNADIPSAGHYCFVGLINSGNDPAPDPATIHTINDYYNFIRQSNNATWKNFDVLDLFANSVTNASFAIQGWPRIKLSADLMIDLSQLPSNIVLNLRILKRLSATASLENAKLINNSQTHQKFQLSAGKVVYLRGMNLKTSDVSQASIEIKTPEGIADGNYRFAVAELIDGKEMGRITRLLSVGKHPFLGNRHSHEVHMINCEWAAKTSRRNKVAYQSLELALKHGYDGCHYCLPEYSKD